MKDYYYYFQRLWLDLSIGFACVIWGLYSIDTVCFKSIRSFKYLRNWMPNNLILFCLIRLMFIDKRFFIKYIECNRIFLYSICKLDDRILSTRLDHRLYLISIFWLRIFDIFFRDNIEWNNVRRWVCEFWWMYAFAKFANRKEWLMIKGVLWYVCHVISFLVFRWIFLWQ